MEISQIGCDELRRQIEMSCQFGLEKWKIPLIVGRRLDVGKTFSLEAHIEEVFSWMGKETMAWVGWAMSY